MSPFLKKYVIKYREKHLLQRKENKKTQLIDRATENAQCISHFILQCHQKTGRVVHLKWCTFNSVAHSWELFPQDHVQKKLLKLVKKKKNTFRINPVVFPLKKKNQFKYVQP